MPATGEGDLEQRLAAVVRHIAHQPEPVPLPRPARIRVVDDGARLQRELVRAVVGALEEDELVLVGVVQGTRGVEAHAEVQRLDAGGAGVVAGVGGGEELGAAEARLGVGGGGGEDGGVVDGYGEGLVGGGVELGDCQFGSRWVGWWSVWREVHGG